MDFERLLKACLSQGDVEQYMPFEDDIIIIRHRLGRKWCAFIAELDGKLCVNLKCDPMKAEMLRNNVEGIRAGWHMNKRLWITVEAKTVDDELTEELIRESYELTLPKPAKRRKA